MGTSEWSRNWSRTSLFPALQNKMSQLLWDFFPPLCFWNVFQKSHLGPKKPFTKWVLVAWETLVLVCLGFFLWETFLAECQYLEGNWGQGILRITCHFVYLFFLPKLRHIIVKEFLKISILRCPRSGIQKHLLILETLACSIQILAAVKKHSFKMDTVL